MSNVSTWFGLENTTCVLAGAGGLIGRGCAQALHDCGARVIALDVLDNPGLPVDWRKVDITQPGQVAQLFATLEHTQGRDWAFVHCAYPRTAAWSKLNFDNIPFDEWNQNFQIQLGSTFLFSQAAVRFMSERGVPGSLVNFGSIYGLVGPQWSIYEGTPIQNNSTYAAIKGGVASLTRWIATTYGSQGIRANVVCPGGIEDRQPESFRDAYAAKTPMARMGNPGDIAGVVAFLAGPASRYVTGQVIAADGGWTAW
jgi:NAD(P)-dependent dehydrogenase (short-subunit alcohol dehydrogenase family)